MLRHGRRGGCGGAGIRHVDLHALPRDRVRRQLYRDALAIGRLDHDLLASSDAGGDGEDDDGHCEQDTRWCCSPLESFLYAYVTLICAPLHVLGYS